MFSSAQTSLRCHAKSLRQGQRRAIATASGASRWNNETRTTNAIRPRDACVYRDDRAPEGRSAGHAGERQTGAGSYSVASGAAHSRRAPAFARRARGTRRAVRPSRTYPACRTRVHACSSCANSAAAQGRPSGMTDVHDCAGKHYPQLTPRTRTGPAPLPSTPLPESG